MGAGSASFTATDLLLWLAAIRNQKIFEPREAEYPYGWGGRNYFEQPALEQTGLHEGASAAITIVSKADLDVVCLSNLKSGFSTGVRKTLPP